MREQLARERQKRKQILILLSIIQGIFSIVYISPEAMQTHQWRNLFRQDNYRKRLCLVACDEAHCISQWGNDFRPSYLDVSLLRSLTRELPFMLLTATCTPEMKSEILGTMYLVEDEVTTIATIPDRPNLMIHLTSKPQMKMEECLEWYFIHLKQNGSSSKKTIIYCRTINAVSDIFEYLGGQLKVEGCNSNIVEMYHSSVSKGTEDWVLSELPKVHSTIRCLVTTVAFGMGVQIRDIDIVIHWGASKTPLSYWQEVGRCGRDQSHTGQAYLYAYLRSLIPRITDKHMIDIVSKAQNGECIRYNVLKHLTIPGMDTSALDRLLERAACDKHCGDCGCSLCTCCSVCRAQCPCR